MGVNGHRGVAMASLAEELVEVVVVGVGVDPTIGEVDEGHEALALLKSSDLDVLLDQFEHVYIGGHVGPLHAVVEVEVAEELLEDDVVLGHDLVADLLGQAHDAADDLLQIQVLYNHRE